MNTRETRVAGIINALVNPLLMCSFFPIIEGKAALDLSSPTGFWGQLALAVVIAEVVSSLPQFGKAVGAGLISSDSNRAARGKDCRYGVCRHTALFDYRFGRDCIPDRLWPCGRNNLFLPLGKARYRRLGLCCSRWLAVRPHRGKDRPCSCGRKDLADRGSARGGIA